MRLVPYLALDCILQNVKQACMAGVNMTGGKGQECFYKITRLFCITPTDFLVIASCRNLVLFTTQRELANQNFAAASVRRNEQKWVFIAGIFPLSSQDI